MKNENVVVKKNTFDYLAPGGRGWHEVPGEGDTQADTSNISPSSALRASSPSRGEVNSGFTLIELLVVILIIGILAAVAVPQYQVAVGKTRLMKLVATTYKIREAQELYYIQHGTYTNQWQNLDVDWAGIHPQATQLNTNDGQTFILTLGSSTNTRSVSATDKLLPGIEIVTSYANSGLGPDYDNNVVCYANTTNKLAVKICKTLGKRCQNHGNTQRKCYLN